MSVKTCTDCGTELRTMMNRGRGRCSPCEAKRRDQKKLSELEEPEGQAKMAEPEIVTELRNRVEQLEDELEDELGKIEKLEGMLIEIARICEDPHIEDPKWKVEDTFESVRARLTTLERLLGKQKAAQHVAALEVNARIHALRRISHVSLLSEGVRDADELGKLARVARDWSRTIVSIVYVEEPEDLEEEDEGGAGSGILVEDLTKGGGGA